MLILAGVSINAIVGDNGILTKAKDASIASKKASILEAIDLELASYNMNTVLGGTEEVKSMLVNLLNKGLIDEVLCSDSSYKKIQLSDNDSTVMGIPKFDENDDYTIDYAVKKDDYSILLSADKEGIYKANFGEVKMSIGGTVEGGTTLVTDKAFENAGDDVPKEEKGKFTIESDATVMFVTEIGTGGEQLSIYVKSGTHAQIKIFKNMTLTNQGMKRSAIDIEPGGTLDLWIADGATLTVDSGAGSTGGTAYWPNEIRYASNGGYAGIHVPAYTEKTTYITGYYPTGEKITEVHEVGEAILNVSGKGTLIAIGGDAGNGGNSDAGNRAQANPDEDLTGGCGGGGAGAGIGGNGGYGGVPVDLGRREGYLHGGPGQRGEDCGKINISDKVKVYAYGGSGGSGGDTITVADDGSISGGWSGSGAGGYPAAGIGGGGSGGSSGSYCSGGTGFSAGINENGSIPRYGGVNGLSSNSGWFRGNGGGYFSTYSYVNPSYYLYNTPDKAISLACCGGIGGGGYESSSKQDDGTITPERAGKGGSLSVSNLSNIFAYNGAYITDGTVDTNVISNKVSYESIVYAQLGYNIADIRDALIINNVVARNYNDLLKEFENLEEYRTIDYETFTQYKKLGIGSGAGAIEESNGILIVE